MPIQSFHEMLRASQTYLRQSKIMPLCQMSLHSGCQIRSGTSGCLGAQVRRNNRSMSTLKEIVSKKEQTSNGSKRILKFMSFDQFQSRYSAKPSLWISDAVTLVGLCITVYTLTPYVVHNSTDALHPPAYPWVHKPYLKTFDHAAIRRGYQVYKEVCSTCHSLKFVAFRALVDESHTKEEVVQMAAEVEVEDGPDDTGAMFMRPGKLADYLPRPHPNEEAARAANNGALPPDLSLMCKARHGGEDYLYALLTGYRDPPAGVVVKEGLHYNPYFPGGALAMARVLYDDLVEYEDGTPATTSQMAKDVVSFLEWAAEPEHDERKLLMTRALFIGSLFLAGSVYLKRLKWAPLKNRKIIYQPPHAH